MILDPGILAECVDAFVLRAVDRTNYKGPSVEEVLASHGIVGREEMRYLGATSDAAAKLLENRVAYLCPHCDRDCVTETNLGRHVLEHRQPRDEERPLYWPVEKQERIVGRYLSGERVVALCKDEGISTASLYVILDRYGTVRRPKKGAARSTSSTDRPPAHSR